MSYERRHHKSKNTVQEYSGRFDHVILKQGGDHSCRHDQEQLAD